MNYQEENRIQKIFLSSPRIFFDSFLSLLPDPFTYQKLFELSYKASIKKGGIFDLGNGGVDLLKDGLCTSKY